MAVPPHQECWLHTRQRRRVHLQSPSPEEYEDLHLGIRYVRLRCSSLQIPPAFENLNSRCCLYSWESSQHCPVKTHLRNTVLSKLIFATQSCQNSSSQHSPVKTLQVKSVMTLCTL